MRNKQFLHSFLLMGVVATIGTILVALLDVWAGLVCLITCSVLLLVYSFFTRKRYKQIAELSAYLTRIYNGDFSLVVQEYDEGELSILKTNIYKMAVMLRSQTDQIMKDKLYLADSLADISHQLKTPITSMIVMSDLLKDENLHPVKQREFLTRLDHQLEKTQWIITNILKLSKLDAGQIQFKEEPFTLAQMANNAVQPFQIMMELKQQTLVLEGDAKAVVQGDLNWTSEAIANIVKNCMEHTPVGGRIRVAYQGNTLYASLTITDNGVGIEKVDLPHIFERFYKGKNSSSDSIGIGLALAKTILIRQNATLEVKSVLGEGATFEIRFYKRVI